MHTEEDEDIDYEFRVLDELTHAYAVTVHRALSGEYPCVVLPLTTSAWMTLQRAANRTVSSANPNRYPDREPGCGRR